MITGNEIWGPSATREMGMRTIHGIEMFTFLDMPENLYEMLARTADKYPEKCGIYDNWGHSETYASLKRRVDQMAAWLEGEAGVKKGSHVGMLLHNSREFCVTFYALAKMGAVSIPFPTKYREPELRALVEKADLDVLIYHEQFEEWVQGFPLEHVRCFRSQDEENGFGFRHLLTDEWIGREYTPSRGKLEDPIIIMFTSGTTSQSKGVVLRNYNAVHAIMTYCRVLDIKPRDKTIIPVPIYHITGLIALLGLFIYAGGSLYLYRRYDARRILECIRKEEITFMHGSPTVYGKMMDFKEEYPELPSLKVIACGSSYMPVEKMKEFHRWLPDTKFQVIYGMTETSSPALIFPGDSSVSEYAGAAGWPVPGIQFKFLDDKGKELGPGQVGEVWVRGSMVLEQYYKMETGLITSDHWLNTGDMGYYNEKYYVYIVDRKKDMINRGGEKIWCTDIEDEIQRIPGVKEVAVAGIPDAIYGEVAAAVVVAHPGTRLSREQIQDELKDRVARYKIPQKILFVDEIPKTPGLKVDKKHIRTMFGG